MDQDAHVCYAFTLPVICALHGRGRSPAGHCMFLDAIKKRLMIQTFSSQKDVRLGLGAVWFKSSENMKTAC